MLRVSRKQNTKQRARGKWRGILGHILGPKAVSTKHGPCPMCGGDDRYRFDNNRNNGDWICNVCGVGDGFLLLQKVLGISFADAAKMVDDIVGTVTEEPFTEVVDVAKHREHLNKLWRTANAPQVMAEYLRGRGIPDTIIEDACDLRGIAAMPDWDAGKTYPGMVALIRNRQGQPISIHRTFIGMDSGKRKKIMPPIETITGGAIRLGTPDKELVLAEGIETALSAWAFSGVPAWALISAHNLETFDGIPESVEQVIIYADNDRSFTGQAAAFACAKRLLNQRQLKVDVVMPPAPGFDMNDHLVREGFRSVPLIWNGT